MSFVFLEAASSIPFICSSYSFTTLLFLGVSSVGAIVLYSAWDSFFRLNHVPGPRCATVTRLWLANVVASGSSHDQYVELNDRYGPLVRIGPNHLLTDDPETTMKILAARSSYTRGRWYDSLRLDPHRPNLVAETHPGKHDALRHQMSAGYGGKEIPEMEAIIDERFLDWTQYIDEYGISNDDMTQPFDIGRSTQYLTTDIISHLCFGKPIGFVAKHEDVHGFLHTLETRLPIAEQFSVISELFTVISSVTRVPFLKRWMIPQNTDGSGVGRILGISHKAINDRLAQGIQHCKDDILTSFLRHNMHPDQAETEITVSLFAGTDTTATALRATLLYLLSSPPVYNRVCSEIRSRARSSRVIQLRDAQRLSYLQACIKEGLRLFPPVTALRERLVPIQGDILCGLKVPGGVNLGFNTKGLLRNKTVFGCDANVFRPERWLRRDSECLKSMEKVYELVFGGGSTRCLGVKIATFSLNKFFVELLKRYDLALLNPEKPWRSVCHGIFFQSEFYIRIVKRDLETSG